MSFTLSLSVLLVTLLASGGVLILWYIERRRSEDVLLDLQESDEKSLGDLPATSGVSCELATRLERAGLLTRSEQRAFLHRWRIVAIVCAVGAGALGGVISGGDIGLLLIAVGLGAALAVFARGIVIGSRERSTQREIDFYLPVVMERIVMAAQAGLDVVPAVAVAAEPAGTSGTASSQDTVSRLLGVAVQYIEGGASFRRAIETVVARFEHPGLRHAFIHLTIAHEQGGEIVMPLRELSDSSQAYYQDTVEEEIAALPVKATLPLLCIFTGLVISFLTPPFIQVIDSLLKAQIK